MITAADIFSRLRSRAEAGTRQDGVYQFRALATAHQYQWPYAITQALVKPGRRVLDWGCGNGHFSQFLLDAGYVVTAFAFGEPTPLVADLLRANPDKFSYRAGSPSDPVQLPFAAGSFDAVASVGVLEHVRETGGEESASLREIHRLLTAGGLFLCFHFPNRYSWIEGLTYFFPSRFHHTYRFTKTEIAALAREAGFEVLLVRRYNAIPRNIFFHFSPRWRRSRGLALAVDSVDAVLAFILNPFCQNYGFVLRKPAPTASSPPPAPIASAGG